MDVGKNNERVSSLHLVGAYIDRKAINSVRELVQSHGQEAVTTPWMKSSRNDDSPLAGDPAPAILFCWSAATASLDYKELHAFARALNQQGRYLGITLDGSPAPVALDASTIGDLATALVSEGARTFDRLRPRPEYSFDPMRWPVGALRRWKRWLDNIPTAMAILAVGTMVVAYANGVENTCKLGFLREPCRLLPGSGIPSRSEEAAWKRIDAGSRCEAFEQYLRANGPKAPYSAEATQRLELSSPVSGERIATFELHVPDYDQPPRPTRAAAEAEVVKAASARSRTFCSLRATNFEAQLSPGAFRPIGAPSCARAPGGIVCAVSGSTECRFKTANANRFCSPRQR